MHVDEKYCALKLASGKRQWKEEREREILQDGDGFYELSTRASARLGN